MITWVEAARKYEGLTEVPGPGTNPTIAKWLQRLRAWWSDDEVPWCGVAVAAWMQEAGITLPKHWYRAVAWMDWGANLSMPTYGCVVIFSRKGGGHVGLVVGEDEHGRLMVLGGNQRDRVTIAPFDRARVLGYRWPPGQPIGYAPMPKYAGNMPSSTNEA